MKKPTKFITTILLSISLLVPIIVKADCSYFFSEKTSRIWSGTKNIFVKSIGDYTYVPSQNAFAFDFDISANRKAQNNFIIEDSILGKPVYKVSFYGNNLWADNINPNIKNVYVPDNVRELSEKTFANFNIENIRLPNSITLIPKELLWENKKLKAINLPSMLIKIDDYSFGNCSGLNFLDIPSTVTSIGKDTFNGCDNLKGLHISNNVKKIGKDAFTNCKKLTIYCEKNSYAYKYAKKNKIKIKLLSNKMVKATKLTNLPSSISVGTYETYLLFPFVEPFYATNQKLAYISDEPSIAEVNQNGKIDGKKKGTTTISVMTTDGSNIQKKIKVIVKRGETRVNPYFSLYQLKKGITEFNLDAMLYNRNPKATYQIESSDSQIATAKIVDGILKVTAKKQGNAKFVVTEKKENEKDKIGSFPISVDNKEKPPYQIVLPD